MSKQSADCIASKLNRCCLNAILAGDQWWPFAFYTRNYTFVAPQIRPFCKK